MGVYFTSDELQNLQQVKVLGAFMQAINRADYKELDLLLWDIRSQFIEPKIAFELYEKRWGYVNQEELSQEERRLIESLTKQFGNGYFMPATL